MKRSPAIIISAVALVSMLGACKSEPVAVWKPVEGRIMTRWAAKVTPEAVLPEYPRPQLVREKWLNLNGPWDYAITAKDAGRPDAWDGRILVPFAAESALSGVGKPVGAEKALWYRRTVTVPKDWRGGRVLLHFGAVDWESTVWVNGREAGTHRGGYDPFTYDITEALKRGTKQELVVRVLDPTDENNSPIARGKQVMKPHGIFYTAVTGIWQTVWLEPVPGTYIVGLKATPDIDRKTLTFEPAVAGASPGISMAVTATLKGNVVASVEAPSTAPAVLDIPEPELWSPDNPALYEIKAVLKKGGKVLDEVASYAGMRKISLGKDDRGFLRLCLNNAPLFQLGPLDQGWWPDGLYTAPTDAALRYDIETIKALGMNMLRKHVKVEPDRLYYWCDKLGLLVWQDMPSALYERDAHSPEALAERDARFEGEWKAVMNALYDHPSIVMWVPFNEGWGQYDTERIAAWTKQHDPTRLVNNASGWTDKGVGDVSDIHSYPGPAMPPVEEKRAVVLGEFGGLGLPLTGHLWQAEGNWGYRNFDDIRTYETRYAELIKNLYPLADKGLAAAVYTQTSDCEIEVNGLMTYDREVVKLEPARFAPLNRGFLPPRFTADQTQFVGPFFIVDLAVRPGATIRYTTDGTEPLPSSELYQKPIVITGETTIKARAYWSDGTSSLVESRTFERAEPVAAAATGPSERGLAYEYFEGRFDKLPDFTTLQPARTGTAARPDLAAAGDKDEFALRFKGFVRVPETGVYIFYLASDDGSRLSVAGREIIANDGVHGMAEEKAEIALAAGWHPFELIYFQGLGGLGLELNWRGPRTGKTPIPTGAFRH
jgi:Glycosyl hydrolases family 2, sugar binding domain/PA14 domain/Chitobiase/beta-hexosaminidase C-terminal domain/Glycosyl hydrolases family 2/Glycosyl hydrolases family 2, TIM barrel domain